MNSVGRGTPLSLSDSFTCQASWQGSAEGAVIDELGVWQVGNLPHTLGVPNKLPVGVNVLPTQAGCGYFNNHSTAAIGSPSSPSANTVTPSALSAAA